MVSDQEIANCVESLLRQPDPSGAGVTVTGVVQQLEAKLGLPLSHKADFIKEKIGALLRPPPPLHHQQQLQLQQQFQLQQQQQYYFAQQQMAAAAAAAVQSSSPFTHLPQRHELAFRCAPPPMQMQQHQHQHQVAAAAMGAAGVQRQEVQFSPGVSVPPAANAKGSQPAVKRRGGPGGLSKVCGVSPELQAIVGEPALPRTQIVKQLWAYIRKNNLQDPNNKRKIICNDELRLVFETDSTDMFKMNKLLAKHIIALEPTKESAPNSKRQKASDVSPSVVSPSVVSETAEYPVAISNALAGFFGTEEREMLQSEALKRVWDYIKENQLEDSVNTTISCDAKLQELFGCESLSSADVSEMVSRHLFKQS